MSYFKLKLQLQIIISQRRIVGHNDQVKKKLPLGLVYQRCFSGLEHIVVRQQISQQIYYLQAIETFSGYLKFCQSSTVKAPF